MTAHPLHFAMDEAIALARLGRFQTAPNPAVGAVLVQNSAVVAQGRHTACGAPHAEVEVLRDAAGKGIDVSGCTLVVTLEPCSHYGHTPPCTDAIIKAGIKHVVIGASDPNPEAAGGAEILRRHGVTVETGLLRQECEDLIADFTTWQTTDLPYTILKLASTLDGRIATRTGHSKWISCEETRDRVHAIRRYAGAVIIGGNTFYQDNPKLTYRPRPDAPPAERQPLAVVVTSRLPTLDPSLYLLKERPEQTIFWTTVAAAASPRAEALRKVGARVLGLSSRPRTNTAGHGLRAELELNEGLSSLRKELGCLYTLCEGGGRLGLSLLSKGLAHELHLHLSPRILADNEATALFDGLSPLQIDDALPLRFLETERCRDDLIITLRPGGPLECMQENGEG